MSRSLNLRSSTAATAALIVAGWGVFALPAASDPGNGNGIGIGNGASQADPGANAGKDDKGGKDDKDAKGPKGNNGKGPKGDNGKGPKGNNGNHGQGNDAKGPRGGNGNDAKGPKGNSGSAGDTKGGNGDPAGNNGTVKITPIGEDDGIPQNTPHVSCGFDIEWYGFDEGTHIVSAVEFAMQAPTSDVGLSGTDPSTVFVGGDPASGAGTDSGFDGEATYWLAFDGEPHPQQGYHVKLTVHTPGSQGADTKHKVFWVQPCEDTPVTPEAAAAEQATPAPGAVEESSDDAGVMGTTGTADEVSAQSAEIGGETGTTNDSGVMGTQAEVAGSGADVPNQVDAGGEGSGVTDLVSSPLFLLVIALGLALGGAALVARRRTA